MKKLLPIFLVFLLFSGCETRNYTPVINEDLKLSAIYKTGEFSFSCVFEKKGDTLSITPTSTRAKGTVISCDSGKVTFKRNNLVKSFDIGEIDKTNPAVLLHQVFSELENAEVSLVDGVFQYSGKCSLGSYILKQKKDNSIVSIEFPQAGISVVSNA